MSLRVWRRLLQVPEDFLRSTGADVSSFVASPATAASRVVTTPDVSIATATLVMAGRLTYCRVPHASVQVGEVIGQVPRGAAPIGSLSVRDTLMLPWTLPCR